MRQFIEGLVAEVTEDIRDRKRDVTEAWDSIREVAAKRFSPEKIAEFDPEGQSMYTHDKSGNDYGWLESAIRNARAEETLLYGFNKKLGILKRILREIDKYEPAGEASLTDVAREVFDRLKTATAGVKRNSVYKKDRAEMRYFEGRVEAFRGMLLLLGLTDKQIDNMLKNPN